MPFKKGWNKPAPEHTSDVTAITDAQRNHDGPKNANATPSIKKRVTISDLEAACDHINSEISNLSNYVGLSESSTGATTLVGGQTSNTTSTELVEIKR